jgi:Domain of Unknown Function (DUF1206)
MRGREFSLESIKDHSERVSHEARHWIIPLARFGYAAKGTVYIIIGVLAALAAFNKGGRTTDSRGAFGEILSQPYGQVLLGAIAVGLAGYALWCVIQAIKDTENKGAGAKGIVIRLGYAVVGLLHAGLALTAVQLIVGSGGNRGGEESSKEWTAALLAQPFGQWLVGAVGVGIIIVAIAQFYQAYTAKFREQLMREQMSGRVESLAKRAGQIGLAARGVVFGMIGIFLMLAALYTNPNAAQGLSGALRTLEQQPFGPWVLGVVALGLVAYGIYMLVLMWYRRIIL